MAQFFFVTAFNTVGTATGHDHWLKDAEDVEPIVGPLCRMVEQLPAKQLKDLEKRFNWIALALGFGFVTLPDLAQEIRIRRADVTEKKGSQGARSAPGPVTTFRQAETRPGGFPGDVHEPDANGRGAQGGAPWSDTLPPAGLPVDY